MNQILSVEMPKKGKQKKQKASVHSVVIVFAIFLIVFGIGLVSSGAYAYYKNISGKDRGVAGVTASTKPIITVEHVSINKININVEHDKEIASVQYKFNDGEEVEEQGKGNNKVAIQNIKVPNGDSTLSIFVKDVNGITASREESFSTGIRPNIKLEQLESQVQVTVDSEIDIDNVLYYWDNDKENGATYTVNDKKYVFSVDVISGTHTLNVVATDVNKNEAKEYQKLKVVTKPKVEVELSESGDGFVIKASDEEELANIEIKLNSDEVLNEEITGKEYQKEIKFVDGINKLVVKVKNKSGIQETKKVKYSKE